MKKIILSIGILSSILILNSCSNELENITKVDSSIEKSTNQISNSQSDLVRPATPKPIFGSYIVVYKESETLDVEDETSKINKAFGGNVDQIYKYALKGFAVSNLNSKAIEGIKKNPKVAYVEQDMEVFAVGTQSPTPSWGLDRVDQTSLPLNNTYNYTSTGSGVKAYIIDTGIKLDHVDFTGRVVKGIDVIDKTFKDGNGHGTHVAGTVGGTTYGIAKGVTLVAVRVLNNNGSGTISGVIAGIDWVTNNHTPGPAVANMSLGGGVSASLDAAVRNSIADGVVYCIAAGNSAADASTASPARVTEAITVAASDVYDNFAYYSNYGSIVDIIAPGTNITSDWNTSKTATKTISGTSMATPHVTGVAAQLLSVNPTLAPADVQSLIKSSASSTQISNVPSGTANALLNASGSTL
ncbi:MAG: S8 family serine peptidase [Aquirufa sp.]